MDAVSVIIPASNEASLIGRCLDSLRVSRGPDGVQVIVVANGCHDDTAARARQAASGFAARGWSLNVLERADGGKIGALNAGDAAATGRIRVYLDADVTLSPDTLPALAQALDRPAPTYASGQVRITAQGWVARAYARIWRQVPFMSDTVPGCGLFAVNAAGRARWDSFPEIISDDIFVRLHFQPSERIGVAPDYRWPIAEGLAALIRVRRRQDAGVDEIARRFPHLLQNDDPRPFPLSRKLRIAASAPLGFGVYGLVALVSRLTRHRAKGWSRSR